MRATATFRLGVICGAVTMALVSSSVADDWVEVRSSHFVIVSNASTGDAEKVTRELERFRDAFEVVMPGAQITPPPTLVFAVKNENSLKELLPAYWEEGDFRPVGVFRQSWDRQDIALRLDARGESRYGTVYHEYIHLLTRLNSPGLPTWLNEGLSEFWETALVKDDKVEVGRISSNNLRLLRRFPLIPLTELFAVDTSSPLYDERLRISIFYAQSWALTHYFMIDQQGGRRGSLMKFISLIRQGEDATAAEEAFGDIDALEKELRRYIRSFRFQYFRAPIDGSKEHALQTRELPEGEALALRGDFLVRGGRVDDALPLVEEALEKSPELALPREARARAYLLEREPELAGEHFAAALELRSPSHLSHYYHGVLNLSERVEDHEALEKHYLRAIELAPKFAPPYIALAQHYGRTDPNFRRALRMARRVVRFEPHSATYRLWVARIVEASGYHDQALGIASRAAALAIASGFSVENNNVCWFGSLAGLAPAVTPACEHAVRLRPEHPGTRDTRGLNRALTGDLAGAVEDFQVFVDEASDVEDDDLELRRAWIEELTAGRNPLDEETRLSLLRGPF